MSRMTRRSRTRHFHLGRRRRKAVAALVVLLLVAVAMATSYATMRSQATALQVQRNAGVNMAAQQAAMAGLSVGLKRLHAPDWRGTGTVIAQALSSTESFQVRFVAGDDALSPGDVDYGELPYRVTLYVTGTALDGVDAGRVSHHELRAVARLIPRAMPAEPSRWEAMQLRTFYQTKLHDTVLELPCRIEGSVRLQGQLKLASQYPAQWDPWANYLYDLEWMRWQGLEDARPLEGPVLYPVTLQDANTHYAVVNYLGLSTANRDTNEVIADWVQPTFCDSYRLYPGGPVYAVPRIATLIDNVTMEADTETNPLGLFYCGDHLTLGDNVTLRGTLICKGDVRIDGTNVHLEPAALPPLLGDSTPIRLPTVTCCCFRVKPESSCTVKGLLAAFDRVEVQAGEPRGKLNVAGRVIAAKLDIQKEESWARIDWWAAFEEFCFRAYTEGTFPVPAFPVWMQTHGYPYEPTVVLTTGEDVDYHWHRPGETVFAAHPDDTSPIDAAADPGLRWELVDISEPQ